MSVEVAYYPEGRDWRCLGKVDEPGCGFSKPEDAPGQDCPDCGRPLSRVLARTVSRPKTAERRFF